MVLVKRCLDLTDLLATAATGTATVALVSHALPGLDADSVDRLARAGVRTVAVVPEAAAGRARADAAPRRHPGGAGDRPRRRRPAWCARRRAPRWTARERLVPPAAAWRPPDAPEAPAAGAPARSTAPAAWSSSGARRAHRDGPPSRSGSPPRRPPAASPSRSSTPTRTAERWPSTWPCSTTPPASSRRPGPPTPVSSTPSGWPAWPVRWVPGLRLVSGLPRPDRWPEVRPQAFAEVLDTARTLDPLVVVDAGFGLSSDGLDPFDPAPQRDAVTTAALEAADDVVVVASADPVGLTRLARGLLDLVDVLRREPTLVVVNRMRSGLGWAPRDVVDMVARVAPATAVVFVPDDREAADRALVAGQTLVEGADSALRRGVAEVAGRPARPTVPVAAATGRPAPPGQTVSRRTSPPRV